MRAAELATKYAEMHTALISDQARLDEFNLEPYAEDMANAARYLDALIERLSAHTRS